MGDFKGMVGRALAQQRLKMMVKSNEQMVQQGKARQLLGNGMHSGTYLFIPNPECCPKCSQLGLSPHFFNTPDVAFISHPNCKCATMEAPAGLSPEELMEWAQHPVGELRYGWNYGISFRPVRITEKNRFDKTLEWKNRVRPLEGSPRTRRKVRATASESQIRKIRRAVKSGKLTQAEDVTERILSPKAPDAEPRVNIGKEMMKRREERALQAKKKKEEVSAQKPLRKGNTWNPNKKKKAKEPEISVNARNAIINSQNEKNRKRKMSVGGAGVGMENFKKKKKKKDRIAKIMKKLGYEP